jgi:hypothetical protein
MVSTLCVLILLSKFLKSIYEKMGAAFDPPSADGDYFGVFVAPYMDVEGILYECRA